jgi:hypothetical protein
LDALVKLELQEGVTKLELRNQSKPLLVAKLQLRDLPAEAPASRLPCTGISWHLNRRTVIRYRGTSLIISEKINRFWIAPLGLRSVPSARFASGGCTWTSLDDRGSANPELLDLPGDACDSAIASLSPGTDGLSFIH